MRFAPASEEQALKRRHRTSRLEWVLKRDDIRAQFVWYFAVGTGSLLTDLLAFTWLLAMGAPVPLALVVGFVIGTLVNYVLSRALAFTGGRFRRWDEILRLFAVALIGLVLTALLVAVCMGFGLSAIAAKLVATPVAFFWNYLGRRIFVFHAEMPTGIWRLSTQAVELVRAGVARGNRDD